MLRKSHPPIYPAGKNYISQRRKKIKCYVNPIPQSSQLVKIGFKHYLGYDSRPVRQSSGRDFKAKGNAEVQWSWIVFFHVQEVIVKAKDDIVFIFKNGFEVSV